MNKKVIQTQLGRLLLILVVVTAVNIIFLWVTLGKLRASYKDTLATEKIATHVGDLALNIYEENVFSTVAPTEGEEGQAPESPKRLTELRRQIKQSFKEVEQVVSEDEKKLKAVKDMEAQWQRAKTARAREQVLVLINAFVKEQYLANKKYSANIERSTQATLAFVGIYMILFCGTLFILYQYLRRRVFSPLQKLSEDMKEFEVSEYKNLMLLTHEKVFRENEIGELERKYFEMALRVAGTVEELKAIDQVKTDFLSLASHELRTPMTAVKGSLSLILSGGLGELDEDTKNLLLISEKETDRLIRLINDILDLTKIEAKKMPLNKKWISLKEAFENVRESMKGLFEMASVKLEICFEETENHEMLVDSDRLQQVLTNLISNAVKYSPKGESVILGAKLNQNSILQIYVQDRGPGIDPSQQGHMFEKFASRDLGHTKIMKGTGLGLPICKALVEEHGGEIGLTSSLGAGSRFYFTLPEFRLSGTPQPETEAA